MAGCDCKALENKMNQIIDLINNLDYVTKDEVVQIGYDQVVNWCTQNSTGVLSGITAVGMTLYHSDMDDLSKRIDQLRQFKMNRDDALREFGAKADVERANANAKAADTKAKDAMDRAQTAQAKAKLLEGEYGSLDAKVSEAKDAANTASSDASAAKSDAKKAKDEANIAKKTADESKSIAEEAKSKLKKVEDVASKAAKDASDALGKGLKALEENRRLGGTVKFIEKELVTIAGIARKGLGIALKVLEKIGFILDLIVTFISYVEFEAKFNALSNRVDSVEKEAIDAGNAASKALGYAFQFKGQIAAIEKAISQIKGELGQVSSKAIDALNKGLAALAKTGENLSKISGLANQLSDVSMKASSALSRSKENFTKNLAQDIAISAISTVALGAAGKAAEALGKAINNEKSVSRLNGKVREVETVASDNKTRSLRNEQALASLGDQVTKNKNDIAINKGLINKLSKAPRQLIQRITKVYKTYPTKVLQFRTTKVVNNNKTIVNNNNKTIVNNKTINNTKIQKVDLSRLIALLNRNNSNILKNFGIATQAINVANKISTNLNKFRKWSGFNRITGIINLLVNLSNAYQLSANLGQTLFFLIDSGLQLFSFHLKDDEGNEVDFSQFLGGKIEDIFDQLIGQKNTETLKADWRSFNRIYQTGINLAYNLQFGLDATRDILEITGENTGRLGNALKRSGVVLEDSYAWMQEDFSDVIANPKGRWKSLFTGLEKTDNVANSMLMVCGDVQSIQDSVQQMGEGRQEFMQEINTFGAKDVPGNPTIESDEKQKDQESQAPASLDSPYAGLND